MADHSVTRVLVANRGEIAVRVIRACRALGLETVLAVSEFDRGSMAARLADRTVCIGPAPAGQSYLHTPSVLQAAVGTGCDAVHPGYGFLSENPEFARECEAEGLTFVGPRAEVVAEAGDKVRAREAAERAGIPVLAASPVLDDVDEAVAAAHRIGFPVLIKAAAGGGGRGMVVAEDERELAARFTSASAEAASAFGDGRVYVERYVPRARHIEVQVLGDRHGNVVHVGERDCSLQRRHQKVLEEAPAPGLDEGIRRQIREAGRSYAEMIGLDSAGTVEFVYDTEREDFAFLEFNARIQVEHPVSEMVSGIDLVQAQIRSARGEPLPFTQEQITFSGHAIEARITTESVLDGFLPRTGTLSDWLSPGGAGVRVDTYAEPGLVVGPYYDSLLAKVIAHGDTREQAADRLREALGGLVADGLSTTSDFIAYVLGTDDFAHGAITTTWIDRTGLAGYRASVTPDRKEAS
ncbi:acetyl/propionyl/methylcrotonyl-CoA carboxylase subunit alpha [Nocardioides sp. NPDC101246]|uniref:acetyl-CoA carboxylase biotin carboxylase subunit n=1 Tax=Nocardioides sp. NPDC101246 TaxID=3364336 RepID=UPI0037F2C946